MTVVSKSVLKAHMLAYFRKVEETGEELVVTSHKTPTLKLVPIHRKKNVSDLFSGIRNVATLHGDLTEPETEAWGTELLP